MALQRLLTISRPGYRHHLLLLEERGGKLAKLHGAVAVVELRRHYSGDALCGWLARTAGLRSAADPITPRALVAAFDWAGVASRDCVVAWTGQALVRVGA